MDESSAAKEPQADQAAAPPPSQIAERYRVLRVLGEGSTGTVYLCEHTALEKEVAVKVLHRDLADNPGLVARFTREAQTAARLDHPSSVHVMDFGQAPDGTLYLAMEYVEGLDLSQLLDRQPQLGDERIVHIMSCILSALSAAHALGIVHRDLKPENVLIRSSDPSAPSLDVVKVCDFGVAQFSPVRMANNNNHQRRATDTRRVTGDGMLVGTPWYMSPEQARAEALDARSDIYSAGVVLFQLLTRTLPFMGDDVMAVALMHCTTPPPPPSGFGAVHPGLEAVCLRALSKTREARYQTANEMLLDLRAAVLTKVESRSLARVSSVPGTKLAVSPLAAAYPTLSGTATPLSTPTVKHPHPPTIRLRKLPTLLLMGVAACALGAAVLLRASQPTAARVRIQNDPSLQPVAAAPAPALAIETQRSFSSDALPPAPPTSPTVTAQVKPAQPAAAGPRPRRARVSHAVAAPAARTAEPATPAIPPIVEEEPSTAAAATETTEPDVSTAEAPAIPVALEAPAPAVAVPEAPVKPQPTAAAPVVVAPKPAIAHVLVSAEHLPPGTSRSSLYSALSQASLVGCYVQAQQRAPQANLPATALELRTNTSGRIVWAHASSGPAALRECLEQVARSGHVRTGEGGEVQATLNLAPTP